ncbi:phosphoglycerate mutase family protein [Neobacillus mesonae]|nr:phosphoglycerate mutase family protein [Neobacillus mesonae]
MELVFIRHAEGNHTVNWPYQLYMKHPALTERGIQQAEQLRALYPLVSGDVIIASPTRRTIETVNVWSRGISVQKYVTPLLGPRMFPQNPAWEPLGCDEIYTYSELFHLYPEFTAAQSEQFLWSEGINTIPQKDFEYKAAEFLEWVKEFNQTVYCVSHDGTINSYRQFLGESDVTRNDFLKETGTFRIEI